MPNRVRINLVNPAELLELPGIGPEQAGAILRFRAEHGPIKDRSPRPSGSAWTSIRPTVPLPKRRARSLAGPAC